MAIAAAAPKGYSFEDGTDGRGDGERDGPGERRRESRFRGKKDLRGEGRSA